LGPGPGRPEPRRLRQGPSDCPALVILSLASLPGRNLWPSCEPDNWLVTAMSSGLIADVSVRTGAVGSSCACRGTVSLLRSAGVRSAAPGPAAALPSAVRP